MGIIVVWYFMPKYITKAEMMFLSVFSVTFQQSVDIYLDLKYDLYGYFGHGIDWGYVPIMVILFPGLMNIYTNFFPYGKPLVDKLLYILGWTLFATTYEHFAVKSSFFYYNGWKLVWSVMMYPFLFSINAIVFYVFRKTNKDEK